jgi:Alpha-glutamyl/putrescinyl thymine pyrophosphorylase clade 3
VPTFCRHNRFIERCPICSKTLPGASAGGRSSRGAAPRRATPARAGARPRRPRGEALRVHREDRAADDGYRSTLLPGLRSSLDASRLAEEIGFSCGRLIALGEAPPDLYDDARRLAREDLEQATWICFLIAYLSPLAGEDPFAGIRVALSAGREELDDLEGIPLGPRTSHDPAHGDRTLRAYRKWVQQAGSQQLAFVGDAAWSPQRRFERLLERLALPGLSRVARYELLVLLGRLGLYELRADSLHFAAVRAVSSTDPVMDVAKRVFGIGDPLNLDRRAEALAEAISIPPEALDLALANWGAGERATLGFAVDCRDGDALLRAGDALGL